MADLEGLVLKLHNKGYSDKEILNQIIFELKIYKENDDDLNKEIAHAILTEIKKSIEFHDINSEKLLKMILFTKPSGITMQKAGVGCRGEGDFIVHQYLANLASTVDTLIGVKDLDDAGVTEIGNNSGKFIITKMEGMHSRLSEFPFLAGFHVTRAALRDIIAKGGEPIALMIDLHLADDGDIAKLFDFVAGCAAISRLVNVPICSGSTLRIGGDMVIGTRLTGGIAAVGLAKKILPRRNLKSEQSIIMTLGAGGGTISTAAIFSGNHKIVKNTLNLNFIKTAKVLRNTTIIEQIDSMLDITNGGIRNELNESISNLNCGIEINYDVFESLIDEEVLDLLKKLKIDPLGVSIGSMLIFCQKGVDQKIIEILGKSGIKAGIVGKVIPEKGLFLFKSGKGKEKLEIKKREAGYTEIKKKLEEQKLDLENIRDSWDLAKEKINYICDFIASNQL